jgi:phosphoserine phosphatase
VTADPAQPLSGRSRYRFVFFDVDSTLVTIEGIDVLSGNDPAIARLTEAAMNGDLPLDEVYGRRLEIIRPTRAAVEKLGRDYLASLAEGAEQTVRALRDAGAIVHLVTAGIEQAIAPLALRLEIPARAVHAVRLEFAGDGSYVGYDRRSFLTRPGGKELVVRDVRARTHGKAAFIGDGVSDLEARPAVDFFVGFGGVHTRSRVKENADVFVAEPRLTAVLPYLIEGYEQPS